MPASDALSRDEVRVPNSSRAAFRTGRKVGILLLLQLAAALTLPFILSKSITVGSPAFLTAVAENFWRVRAAVLLSFVGSGLTVYLGVAAFPVLRRYSLSVALWFLAVCAVSCTLDVVQAGTILSMLAISKAFVTSGATEAGLYQVVGAAVAAARRSAHITQLVAIGAWLLVFYIGLFRFRLVPRGLAVLGLLGVTSQFIGVTLMMLLGYPSIGPMAMPLLPIQIGVAVWLMVKGFNDYPPAAPEAE
ncbi:DUF4386 domain-containing protein [Hymenobacter lucidus]|uniref:DUF4386 domain-containing protein n=1 Tax=Hymenobacter lucidus TaxID=2880930 RepID=A0ABS8APS1_9BACT|nr:DUF4386 domain-containing protein [Hymenobacter lucidus]MCB2408215.1 DUF4386 domain-containing protein [Hymenobacter lucidus]